jgi:hypothetical protein
MNWLNAFKSKTVWFGLVLAVLSWVQGTLNGSGLTPDQIGIVGTVVGGIVVWLRSVTSVPLSQK